MKYDFGPEGGEWGGEISRPAPRARARKHEEGTVEVGLPLGVAFFLVLAVLVLVGAKKRDAE